MAIKATIRIDDDRWAKHPFSVEFDDDECNSRFSEDSLNSWESCYTIIDNAKRAGYDIDDDIENDYY